MTGIVGVIQTRDVITHAWMIARLFGVRVLLACALAIVAGKPVTFLELACM